MPTILTPEQLAEVLQMNAETLRRMTREGVLPSHRIGGSVRYCLETVLAYTQVNTHPDDQAVDEFATAMHARMAECRRAGKVGWDECPTEKLWGLLEAAVAKRNPVDVGNYAMMVFAGQKETRV